MGGITPPHACLVTARVVGRLMPYRSLTHGVESHHDHVFTAITSSRPYVYRHVRCNDTSPAVEPKQYKIMIAKLGVCMYCGGLPAFKCGLTDAVQLSMLIGPGLWRW